jgi:16S rRNA (guanine966-N2)-methyltransferase
LPYSDAIRPSSDIVKESVFNVLTNRFRLDFAQIGFFDIFAGSGAIGIEAISRMCSNVMFVDRSFEAIKCIRHNITRLGIAEYSTIIHGAIEQVNDEKITKFTEPFETSVIFLDPPYRQKAKITQQIERFKRLQIGKLVIFVVETDSIEIPAIVENRYIISHGSRNVMFLWSYKG